MHFLFYQCPSGGIWPRTVSVIVSWDPRTQALLADRARQLRGVHYGTAIKSRAPDLRIGTPETCIFHPGDSVWSATEGNYKDTTHLRKKA